MKKELSPLQTEVLRLANDGWTLIARGNLVYANDERVAIWQRDVGGSEDG